ncbi:MAG: hypothetical protein LYZ69_07910 [Nitrososphaerales archaeon]|nr:hypothetical protein [Nitrososphaerales archaeon]
MVVSKRHLKERAIYVYLPSVALASKWKKLAAKSGTPVSKFVVEHVENSLRQEEGEEGFKARSELVRELKQRDEEVARLQTEVRLARELADRLDRELRRHRVQPFLDESFQGVRAYEKQLIELFRNEKVVDSDDLLRKLGIDLNEEELIKAIDRQISGLEAYGLLEATARGWKWKG